MLKLTFRPIGRIFLTFIQVFMAFELFPRFSNMAQNDLKAPQLNVFFLKTRIKMRESRPIRQKPSETMLGTQKNHSYGSYGILKILKPLRFLTVHLEDGSFF